MVELKFPSVIQINADASLPKHIQGCLGYYIKDLGNEQSLVRIYVPKSINNWPEYTEDAIPTKHLNYVGEVPENMTPVL